MLDQFSFMLVLDIFSIDKDKILILFSIDKDNKIKFYIMPDSQP